MAFGMHFALSILLALTYPFETRAQVTTVSTIWSTSYFTPPPTVVTSVSTLFISGSGAAITSSTSTTQILLTQPASSVTTPISTETVTSPSSVISKGTAELPHSKSTFTETINITITSIIPPSTASSTPTSISTTFQTSPSSAAVAASTSSNSTIISNGHQKSPPLKIIIPVVVPATLGLLGAGAWLITRYRKGHSKAASIQSFASNRESNASESKYGRSRQASHPAWLQMQTSPPNKFGSSLPISNNLSANTPSTVQRAPGLGPYATLISKRKSPVISRTEDEKNNQEASLNFAAINPPELAYLKTVSDTVPNPDGEKRETQWPYYDEDRQPIQKSDPLPPPIPAKSPLRALRQNNPSSISPRKIAHNRSATSPEPITDRTPAKYQNQYSSQDQPGDMNRGADARASYENVRVFGSNYADVNMPPSEPSEYLKARDSDGGTHSIADITDYARGEVIHDGSRDLFIKTAIERDMDFGKLARQSIVNSIADPLDVETFLSPRPLHIKKPNSGKETEYRDGFRRAARESIIPQSSYAETEASAEERSESYADTLAALEGRKQGKEAGPRHRYRTSSIYPEDNEEWEDEKPRDSAEVRRSEWSVREKGRFPNWATLQSRTIAEAADENSPQNSGPEVNYNGEWEDVQGEDEPHDPKKDKNPLEGWI